jgi:AAA15 family ATPase/GTPase
MRIGLVGVPGSGKTALAESLKTALESVNNESYLPVKIVDNYVESVQEEVDLAMGWTATYVGNLHIALNREAQERIAFKDNKTVITCGTLFETSSYASQSMEYEYQLLTKEDEESKKDLVLRAEAITRILACLYMDTIRYDHIFYLSPIGEIADFRANKLEKNLQAAFNAFEIFPVTHLYGEGDTILEITENRLKTVLKKVLNEDNVTKQDVQAQESN